MSENEKRSGLSRRQLLKRGAIGGAAIAGAGSLSGSALAAGSRSGKQEAITLRVLTLGVEWPNPAVQKQAEKDLGVKFELTAVGSVEQTQKAVTAPESFDIFGGYHQQNFGFASNKSGVNYGAAYANPSGKINNTLNYSDSEVWFGGRTTLANGITVGFDAQAWQALDASHGPALLAALHQTGQARLTLCGERSAQSWSAQPGLSAWRRLGQRLRPKTMLSLMETL